MMPVRAFVILLVNLVALPTLAMSPMTSSAFPWSAVGRVKTEDGVCSGALVGNGIALTAAHCVIEDGQLVDGEIRFQFNYVRDTENLYCTVNHVWWSDNYPAANEDWAVMTLECDTREYGYFGYVSLDNPTAVTGLLTAGYGNYYGDDNKVAAVDDCAISRVLEDGRYVTNCFAGTIAKGTSGGPVFNGNNQIVGIQAQYDSKDDTLSYLVPTSRFEQQIEAVKNR